MKPKMVLTPEEDNYKLVLKAGSILNAHGQKKAAKAIHQETSVKGYDFYFVLKALKKYMDV